MAAAFNQNFVPGWNTIYPALLKKVNSTIISANQYTSPFSQMLQNMEVGEYVEDIHLNPGHALLQDTIQNSDILRDYYDDLATVYYGVNLDLVFPSTYKEYVVRTSATILENASALISAINANRRVTSEYWRTNLVKQMLFNGYQYGMISPIALDENPLDSPDAAGKFIVALNSSIDDMHTEMNDRYVIYNNRLAVQNGTDNARISIATDWPYVIIFNNYLRYPELNRSIDLGLIERFRSGNSNQDGLQKIIRLNKDDFPSSIPPLDRDNVQGDNVSATGVNFYTMPRDVNDDPEFSGAPLDGPGREICAIIVDPSVIKLFTQLEIETQFLNTATLANTNRNIYRGIMELGAFGKIAVITAPPAVAA